jgi:hypothetical protein
MRTGANRIVSGAISIAAALILLATSPHAVATDTYTGTELSIPAVTVGAATFTNMVVTVQDIVGGPSGSSPVGSVDRYDPGDNQLTIPAVTFGSRTYYNVEIDVGTLVSAQSVSGADTYDGTHLNLAAIQVGARTYTGVVLAVNLSNVVKVAGGMPTSTVDQYSPSGGELQVAMVQVGSRVYTNVTLSVSASNIVTVGGSEASTFAIGGRVVGLASPGVVQVLNGNDVLPVTASGSFILPTPVASGGAYSVSVGTTPPNQSCAVQSGTGSGTVAAANVTTVLVYCTYNVSVATLNGSYASASLNINLDKDSLGSEVSFNGAGTWGSSGTAIVNIDGTITTGTLNSSTAGPYTVVTTDGIPVLTSGGNNIGAIAGADADEFFWVANFGTGQVPALAVWVNPLQNGTVASLAGDWCFVNLNASPTAADPNGAEGFLTINADGSFNGNFTILDENGVVTTASQLAPAGSIALTSGGQFGGGTGSVGYVSANGEFLFSTEIGTNAPTGLQVGVKLGTHVTAATLNGVYTVGSLAYDAENVGDGRVYTMIFDGAGNWSASIFENDNGTLSNQAISGTYSVSSGGALTLNQANGNTHLGGTSADGNILVAASLTPGGAEEPRMFFGFRQ